MINLLAVKETSLHPAAIHLSVYGPESLDALHTILHRALNCWADAPPEYMQLADEILRIHPAAKLLPFNSPTAKKQRPET